MGATQVKGIPDPLVVYEVQGVGALRTRLQLAAHRGLVRFVGRQVELDHLHQALDQTKAGHGQVVAVAGEAGVGKSRLFHEFKERSRRGCLVLETFSVSHGKAFAALHDPAPGVDMITTADNLARRHGLSREAADHYALGSHQRVLQAQAEGWFDAELVAVGNETFELAGYASRGIRLPRGVDRVSRDSHPRTTDLAALSRLRPVHEGVIQTAGNSCAVVDGAVAALVGRASTASRPVLAKLLASAVVGVAPEYMGIGPAPAIELLLQRSGLSLMDIGLIEINEAQAAQVLAVAQVLELESDRLNRCGGSIALGHPLADSGIRLVLTLARQLMEGNLRYGICAACVGGGQGMALLIENPAYQA